MHLFVWIKIFYQSPHNIDNVINTEILAKFRIIINGVKVDEVYPHNYNYRSNESKCKLKVITE